jgi:hypothetical protein
MNTPNPYAPPVTNAAPAPGPVEATHVTSVGKEEIAAARRALADHLANSMAVAQDRKLEGLPIGIPAIIIWVIVLGFVGGGIAVASTAREALIIFGIFAFVFGLIALVLTINDLSVGRRSGATTPDKALRRWFRAARAGRAGYLISSLVPPARQRQLEAPYFGNGEPPGPETFAANKSKRVKAYLKSWARTSNKLVRWMKIKSVEVVSQQDDVAVVQLRLNLIEWPQWANILSVVLFVLIRIVGIIVAIVLYYTLRKTHDLTLQKTLLRGENGLWYFLDADPRR